MQKPQKESITAQKGEKHQLRARLLGPACSVLYVEILGSGSLLHTLAPKRIHCFVCLTGEVVVGIGPRRGQRKQFIIPSLITRPFPSSSCAAPVTVCHCAGVVRKVTPWLPFRTPKYQLNPTFTFDKQKSHFFQKRKRKTHELTHLNHVHAPAAAQFLANIHTLVDNIMSFLRNYEILRIYTNCNDGSNSRRNN
jgi:hypothetical protein